MTYR
ncbi:unnamed protein product [Cuscuta epithymum]|jgi:hypothetical protein